MSTDYKPDPPTPSDAIPVDSRGGRLSDAAACLEAGQQLAQAAVRIQGVGDPNGPIIPVFFVKDGYQVELHPELMPRPARATGTLALSDLASFCRHFKKYKNNDSVILVDADSEGKRGANFLGILNYHSPGADASSPAIADHADFRCAYNARLSVEWKRWMEQTGKAMSHAQFLEHLEDNRSLITEPDSAGLLDLIGCLEGKANARFENALNLHNGSMKLGFSEEVELRAGGEKAARPGEMEVPTQIVIGIAPFEFGEHYKVVSKLRYRIVNKNLVFAYEVQDPHVIIMDAVQAQVAEVKSLTGTEPLYGLPPAK